MNELFEQFNTGMPFPDVFPESFGKRLTTRDYFSFRNFNHFKYVVSKLTQKYPGERGMDYAEALRKMVAGESDFPPHAQAEIRNLVRSKLHKRGLISEEVYEAYRYAVDGVVVAYDVGKYAAGHPDCVITPARQYVDFFYELYVSISYPWTITNETIRENCAKLLATVEELERQHIYVKIALVLPITHVASGGRNFFADVPLFSHKEPKSVDTMSAVINDRLLRKFFFAFIENYYGDEISDGYGQPVSIKETMNVGDVFDEIKFFEEVVMSVGAE